MGFRSLLFIMCVLVLAPVMSHAEPTPFDYRPITLILSPEYPQPGDSVRMTVASYALDLDRSTITWQANGKTLAKGVALKEFTITAGNLGTATDVTVTAVDPAGFSGSADAHISPAQIDLLWSSDSYTPPFFKGRKLPGTGSHITAYALVRFLNKGTPIAENNIIYTWYRDDTLVSAVSGRGKSRAVLPGPSFGSGTVRVVAETVDGSEHAEASVPINARDPEVALYENHPLFGILYHRAIVGDVNTIEKELHVTAVPYFARTTDPGTLSYEWGVNAVAITPDSENPQTLTLTASGYTGPADISLTVTNPADILMRSLGAWRLIFGGESGIFSGSLFGQ